MQRKLTILALALAAAPLMAMSRASVAYVDETYEVAMPACSMENCDAKPGKCEYDEGYHLPAAGTEVAVTVARETPTGPVNAE